MDQLGPNALGDVLEPGRVADCYLGLLLPPGPAGEPEAGTILVVAPASLLHPRVPQPDGSLVYGLLTGHPEREAGELVFLRGAVRLHILHHAAGQEIPGAWMAAELARHGYQISASTLYPTLHRTQDEGLLTSRQVTVNGKVRRLHRITDPGRGVLAAGRRAVAELADEVLAGDPAQQEWQR